MALLRRVLSVVGPRRVIGTLGALYVTLAVWRALTELIQGVPLASIVSTTFLIAIPGVLLLYSAYWISQADIDTEFYPDVAAWCLAGLGALAGVLFVYHFQPGEGVSRPLMSPPILMALSSIAGLTVGIYDGLEKTRTRQLERRTQELEEVQQELEETVDKSRQANERLEHYRKYTDDMLDAIDDILYVLAGDGTVKRWNESLCEVTGYSDEEISSMGAVEFFDEGDQEMIAEAIASGFETESTQVEAQLLTKDGGCIPYEFAASTLETPDGSTVLARSGRDITENKSHERELKQRARQQAAVSDLGQFALNTADLDELMHEAARQVADVLGNEYCKVLALDAESEELLLQQGVGWTDGYVGEVTVSAVEANSQAAYTLENDHPIVVEDLTAETRFSGPELLTSHGVKSGISTIIGSFDEPWGILGTHDTRIRTFTEEDVNFVQSVANILAEAIERHRYRRDLEQSIADLETSNERLEQFAYAASHDLQEPLRMVSSYLQLIERRYADEFDEEGQEFLEFAVDGADRMRSMIEGLLDYSRVETQGEPFERVDLAAIFEEIHEDLQLTIEASNATITTETLPAVEGDPDQLRQVFQNLLENAINYSGEGPPVIRISTRRCGDDWIVSVRDEGIGIASEDQDRIFEVFQRAANSGPYNGTGVGLALCKRIIERHEGDIWIDSEPGDGTTVSVTLPAVGDYDG
jgi:PAS domain S-box-containing protein